MYAIEMNKLFESSQSALQMRPTNSALPIVSAELEENCPYVPPKQSLKIHLVNSDGSGHLSPLTLELIDNAIESIICNLWQNTRGQNAKRLRVFA